MQFRFAFYPRFYKHNKMTYSQEHPQKFVDTIATILSYYSCFGLTFDIMKHGIALLGIVPLRKDSSHRSELVSQILFGETYELITATNNWGMVKCSYDNYEGWISLDQHQGLSERDYQLLSVSERGIALDLAFTATSTHRAIPIVAGSSLPFFDGMNFKIAKEKFIYNGQALQSDGQSPTLFERVAMRYLNSPYLWGGRSPFGIDCSGYTQMVYKFCGVVLNRDAYQQAEQGTTVNFVEEAQPGDLAFFNNEEGKIIHVGIVLKDGRIIHSSGKVRIDKLDHFGIFNADSGQYSHQLKIIKRLF